MKNKKIKYCIIALTIVVVLSVLLTVLIGNHFVNYALVPNHGGESRKVTTSEKKNQEKKDLEFENIQKEDKKARDKWVLDTNNKRQKRVIKSKDGLNLHGNILLQEKPTDKWAIIVHGYQSSENESNILARHLYNEGYNILTYSQRAHRPSEGKYIGMGYLEKDDLLLWTNALIKEYPNAKIIYHGTSMGGATVLMASGLSLPKNVKAIISDCAYSSIWDIFKSELKLRFNLPAFPVLYMAEIMARINAGYDIKSGNTVEFVKRSTLPILFIHTKGDDFVPAYMAQKLYDSKKNGKKELCIFNIGKHAQAKYNKGYYEKIQKFLADIL